MNDWVLPWARIIAREKMIRSRSRIQQVRTGSSGSGRARPADSAALAAQGASVRPSADSSSALTVPRCTQSVAVTPDPPEWFAPYPTSVTPPCDGQSPRSLL